MHRLSWNSGELDAALRRRASETARVRDRLVLTTFSFLRNLSLLPRSITFEFIKIISKILSKYRHVSVITCDWADAERDKVRSVANSSDILCCYRTVIVSVSVKRETFFFKV